MCNPDKTRSIRRRALSALFIGAVAIAFSPILVRLSEPGPSATAFYRVFFSLPALWVWLSFTKSIEGKHRQPSSARDYMSLALAGLFFACDLAFWHWSVTLTSVANSTLLANAAPIFVTFGAFFLFGEKFSKIFFVGLICALSGVILVMSDSLGVGQKNLLGDFLGITTAIFYAAYIISVGRLRSEFSTATVMMWSGTVSCMVLVLVTLVSGEVFLAKSLAGWSILLCLALLSQAGGQSLIAYSLAHLPTALGSVGLLIQPVLAAWIAWIVFAEALGGLQLIGGIVVLVGIYLAQRGS